MNVKPYVKPTPRWPEIVANLEVLANEAMDEDIAQAAKLHLHICRLFAAINNLKEAISNVQP